MARSSSPKGGTGGGEVGHVGPATFDMGRDDDERRPPAARGSTPAGSPVGSGRRSRRRNHHHCGAVGVHFGCAAGDGRGREADVRCACAECLRFGNHGWWPRLATRRSSVYAFNSPPAMFLNAAPMSSEVLANGVPADRRFTSVMFQPGMVSVLTSCMVVPPACGAGSIPCSMRAGSKIDVAGRGRGWSVVESRRDLTPGAGVSTIRCGRRSR